MIRKSRPLFRWTQHFWCVPTLITLGFAILALAALEVDAHTHLKSLLPWRLLGETSPDSAMSLLSVIAGAMITAGATVFSINIVALTLASMQFSPRVLRNFMQDRITQVVLGVFLGAFIYCLIVLRTVRGGPNASLPILGISLALLWAFVGIGFLIFFIHRISISLQASHIAYQIVKDTYSVIDEFFPPQASQDSPAPDPDPLKELPVGCAWHPIHAVKEGYIQEINEESLFRDAQAMGGILRIHRGAGLFVMEGDPLAYIAGSEPPSTSKVRKVQRAFSIGPFRTLEQDIACGIWQLVDMALKALSPAVNDTSTGVMCVDHLMAIMSRIAPRSPRSRFRFAGERLRLITPVTSFASLLDQACDQIRHNAANSIAILLRMLHGLHALAGRVQDPERLSSIVKQMNAVIELADQTLIYVGDRELMSSYISVKLSRWNEEWKGFRFPGDL